jgi:hypothetical protein
MNEGTTTMTTTTKSTLILTITTAADKVITTEQPSIPAATRYLERFAAARGWLYSRRKVAANSWAGSFVKGNSATHLATYTIVKKVSA